MPKQSGKVVTFILDCFVATLLAMTGTQSPQSPDGDSLQVAVTAFYRIIVRHCEAFMPKQSGKVVTFILDCFVATLLAMTDAA